MGYRKWGMAVVLSMVIVASTSFTVEAAKADKDVIVFYKNEVGKKLATSQAQSSVKNLAQLDAVASNYSTVALERLKASKNIDVVYQGKAKLHAMSTLNPFPALLSKVPLWNIKMINVQEAWKQGYTGKNVKIGIIDSEISARSELKIVGGKSFISSDGVKDYADHGTFVAGIINAKPASNSNVMGIAPSAELYSLSVLETDGASIEYIVAALNYAIEQKLDVLNISLGITEKDLLEDGSSLENNPLTIAIKKAQEAGITIVAATGNNGSKLVDLPAAYDGVIAVGSVDEDKSLSAFSNYGLKDAVVAPGRSIESLNYLGGFKTNSGTSFSTPHVVGMLAILKEQFPLENSLQLQQRLKKMTHSLGDSFFFGNGLIYYPKGGQFESQLIENPQSKPDVIEVEPKPPVIKPSVPVRKLSPAEKFVKNNKTKITAIIKKMNAKKTVKFNTEFAPLYTVYKELTTKQQATIQKYRKNHGVTVISSTTKSARIKATNLTSIQSKKTSTITFSTAIKASSIKKSNFTANHVGKQSMDFSFEPSKNGKSVKMKTKKKLVKGSYVIYIDTAKFRTTKNKAVKPYVIKYTVK
ncbi:S8 family peptidase [Kurthia sibirica]|uniref:Peptidase S8/S53 domain-containing protein n=1 Tax=Kurthia sibirica TaxID=202750 RepID=A0A2U3AIQ9_9BACL|nr:S8 family serine peptidase [Kurthia sibirica]PWI24341.1 hypothetical protein DEX24_14045 [Kurthia sibirica]GEK34372.1 hypothetical protein KSI01_19050 [Kurthia sibirica]